MEVFRITTEFDGQSVEASCRVSLGRHAFLTMTAPYFPIDSPFFALDENNEIRQFYDREEVKEYAEKELLTIMQQIQYVKQHPKEYAEALNLYETNYGRYIDEFKASEESHQRGMLWRQIELHKKALGEYTDLLRQLIPVTDETQIINPSLLSQILEVI